MGGYWKKKDSTNGAVGKININAMDLLEFKKKHIKESLGISDNFGIIYTFIDFANVNHWFEDDWYNFDGSALEKNEKLTIDIEKLKDFTELFSDDMRFYYGLDNENPGSFRFIRRARDVFGKRRVFTKPIQKVRHYLAQKDLSINTRTTRADKEGTFVLLPKCNFDVEICVDAIKTADGYKTFCLFSGDADFVHLARFLKSKGKNIILVKGGYILHSLRRIADIVISAQDIKQYITVKRAKPSQNG